ncbi:DMT family transporter [Donghicola sp. C2-DW-16]|uniref:DMT family transporter n=1 Tax=Donghicola mangrovi TaxID=2729614 RepID=A0ABX2PAH5_9RHOB|nr:DMT family transporter [Donghicola mangrovi]NVO26458.1 DMT family transporter [Donghicola mangrovi]
MISDNMRGAGLMMAAMAAFTLNDTALKALAGEVPLFQLLFIRGVLATGALALMAYGMKALKFTMSRRDLLWVSLRAVGEASAAYFYLTALFNMPIANATAILQALPLTVTLGAALFMGMPFGWRRGLTIVVGFLGVLLIVRPGTEGFNIYSVYALLSVLCVTLRDLATRMISSAVPSMTVTVTSAGGVMAFFGVLQASAEWSPMEFRDFAILLTATTCIVAGYAFSVMVMRVGDISFVAPFRYTGLIWALILGWLVFGDWPQPLTLLGSAIIVGSGIYMLYREATLGRKLYKRNLARGGR